MTITYDFDDPAFWDESDMRAELDRVIDLCHGCRLCWDLCPSFDSMFKLVDEKTDGIDVHLDTADQNRIVDECYQCKLCYIKCPYVPPHEWMLDFPKLMLRALAVRTGGKPKNIGAAVLARTDLSGRMAGLGGTLARVSLKPNSAPRKLMQSTLGVDAGRVLPSYARQRFTTWWRLDGRDEPTRPFVPSTDTADDRSSTRPSFLEPTEDELATSHPAAASADAPSARPSFLEPSEDELAASAARPAGIEESTVGADKEPDAQPDAPTRDVTMFPTCMVEYQNPEIGKAVARVLRHNGCDVACNYETCCGMPDLDAGDTEKFLERAQRNVDALLPEVRAGRAVVVPAPTCNYALRHEYPAFLKTPESREVADAIVDPAEYLWSLKRADGIADDFTNPLGSIAYHAACHLRAQQTGYKARDLLRLVPDTTVTVVESCAGIDGTWGYRTENAAMSKEIMAPTAAKMKAVDADLYIGDCHLADVAFEEEGLPPVVHPMQALARAYGLDDGTGETAGDARKDAKGGAIK